MRSGRKCCRDFVGGQTSADRQTPAETFRQRHDIRLNPIVLIREERPCSSHAGLPLHQNQQNVAVAAERTKDFSHRPDRRPARRLLLGQLQHDGGGRRRDGLLDGVEIIKRDIGKAGQQRLEALLHFLLTRGRQGGHRAAMERLQHGDDFESRGSVLAMRIATRGV